jgi:hypothetical protein
MKSKVQAAGQFCKRHADSILNILIFAVSFIKAVAESERHSRR